MYKVIIDEVNQQQWEQYAGNFADYSIYQTWPYQQVRCEMDNQQLSRAVVEDQNGKVVTMCQVRIKNVNLLGLKIGYVQWGPLFRDKNNKIICTMEALVELREAYLGKKVNILRFVPNICDNEVGQTCALMLQQSGFERLSGVKPYRTFILAVGDCEEEIRQSLRKSFRRDVKNAEKAGIEIREGNDEHFCRIFEDLYNISLKRKGFKGLNPQEFMKTQSMLSAREKMNIILAYADGEPVSAHLASNLGDTAVVLLAASNEKGLLCGSSYIMWYRGAVAALQAGMKNYDLGGIDPENNPNVYQFKSRMGGQDVVHIGVFEACDNWFNKIKWRMIEKTYKLIRDN